MKKLNKFFAVLVALAMMATLCVSMAFAVDGNPVPKDEESTLAPENGKLVKYLIVPEGTPVPTVTNVFQFLPDVASSSNATEKELGDAAPAEQTIIVMDPAAENDDTAYSAYQNDGNSVVKAVDLNKVNLTKITHPGVYAYTVSEKSASIETGTAGELSENNEKYTVRYTVKYDENKELKVTNITVTKYDEATKKNVTITEPTENWTTTSDEKTEYAGGFSFTNTYRKTEGTGEYKDAPLKISKTVTADANVTKPTGVKFPINIKLTKAVGAEDTALTAAIYKDGEIVEGTSQTVGYGGEGVTFNIEDGQEVVFLKMPAGTRYAVSETMEKAEAYSAYLPKVAVTTQDNDYNKADSTVKPAALSAQYGETLAAQNEGTTILLNAEAKDAVAYENKYDQSIETPTGILISNLPYIALALVAIGGLVAYVVVRRRQSDEA